TVIPNNNWNIVQGTKLQDFPYFHPNKSGEIRLDNSELLGAFGYINPSVASNFELDDSKLIYLEIDFTKLFDLYIKSDLEFREIPKYPGIDRELNFVMDEKTPVGDIISSISNIDTLIKNVRIIDIYRNSEKIGENKKSVTFSVYIQDYTKTITDEDALIIQNKIIDFLAKENIELRK
ncbi:MAG: hypothetical protein PHY51_00680, partial [Candidatus Gracilibacteria bacterium]|nr:hypothetical protein [Candidatus Gracilibacteria bacterium]